MKYIQLIPAVIFLIFFSCNQKYNSNINHIENRLDELDGKTYELENRISDLEYENLRLKGELTELENSIDYLELQILLLE